MKRNHLLVALFLVIIWSSCSFQKRVHNRGFHVDWGSRASKEVAKTPAKQKHNAQDKQAKNKEIAAKDSLLALGQEPIWSEPNQEVLASGNEQEYRMVQLPLANIFQKEFKAKKEQLKLMAKPLNKKQESDLNILSIISLMLGIMSIASVVFLFLTDFELLILASIVCAILAIILGTIALKQTKDMSGKGMDKSFALGGILAGSFTILFWLLLFFLLLLFVLAYI
jgi:hypothetical protein